MGLINSTDYRAAGWVEPAASSSQIYTTSRGARSKIWDCGNGKMGAVVNLSDNDASQWYFWRSDDGGETWTEISRIGNEDSLGSNGVSYGSGRWIVVGGNYSSTNPKCWVSTDDGVTWARKTISSYAYAGNPQAIYFLATVGLFIVSVTSIASGRVYTSADGEVWVQRNDYGVSMDQIGFDGERVIITGNFYGSVGVYIKSSSDGINWVNATSLSNYFCVGDGAAVDGEYYLPCYKDSTGYIFKSSYPFTSWALVYQRSTCNFWGLCANKDVIAVLLDDTTLSAHQILYTTNKFDSIKTVSLPAGFDNSAYGPIVRFDNTFFTVSRFGDIAKTSFASYSAGDLVTHAGAVWQSETDGNLIEPSDTAAEWSFQGPEAYGARTGDLFKHYLPRAKAWLLSYAKNLTNYLRGIHNTIADALIDEIDRTYYDQFAPTTRQGARWDATEGLLPVTGERPRLAARFRARGGQSPKYIQDTLQGAGFSVYVHEWWDPYTGDTRDPRAVLAPFTGGIYEQQMGRVTAQFGPTTTQFGQLAFSQGYPLVNQPTNNIYEIPSDPNTHPYFLYFCDAIYPQPARIPEARRAEFERLLLTICPAHLWLGVIANFDDAPTEFILLETDDSLLLETGGMLGLET